MLDRERAVGQSDQEHGVPFESFGGVQRGEGDPVHGRRVLGLRPLSELRHERRHGR